MATTPGRDDRNLLDGAGSATEPDDDWTWLRPQRPRTWDPNGEVWGVFSYDDIPTVSNYRCAS